MNLQRTCYQEELYNLQRDCVVDRKSPLFNLSPFIGKDGFLRVRGRLDFAPELYYDQKHSIILPKCHTSYLIVQVQVQVQHEIMKQTLITALRNKYWLVGVRILTRKICKRCIICQRQNSKPLDQVTPILCDRCGPC